MSKMTPLIWTLVAIVAIAAAVGLFRLRASRTWPDVPGRVLRAEIKAHTVPRRAIAASDQFQTEYVLLLEYEYTAAGSSRIGRNLLASGGNYFTEKKNAEEMLERFSAGKTIPVYVNPANPDDACLITGAAVPLRGYLVLTVFLLVVIAVVIIGVLVVTGRINVGALLNRLSPRQ